MNTFTRSTVLLGALTAMLVAPGHANTIQRIRESGIITIAHRESSVPFSYYDANKQPVGYAIDLCLKVAEAIKRELKLPNLKVNYLMVTPSTRIPVIKEGKADIECGSTTNTKERRKDVEFTVPHFFAGARMVVKTAANIKNWDDLRGKTVVTTKGTTNVKSLAAKNEERVLNAKLVEGKDHAESFNMVVDGKATAFAMDDVLLYGFRAGAADPTAYAVVGDLLTVEPYAMIVSKTDPDFKKLVDREMARLIVDNEIQGIYKKWFQSPVPTKEAGKAINMNMPMSYLLRDSFKYPTDKIPD